LFSFLSTFIPFSTSPSPSLSSTLFHFLLSLPLLSLSLPLSLSPTLLFFKSLRSFSLCFLFHSPFLPLISISYPLPYVFIVIFFLSQFFSLFSTRLLFFTLSHYYTSLVILSFSPWRALTWRESKTKAKSFALKILVSLTSPSVADPIKLAFLRFLMLTVKLGHFTICDFFLYVANMQAYQQRTEKILC